MFEWLRGKNAKGGKQQSPTSGGPQSQQRQSPTSQPDQQSMMSSTGESVLIDEKQIMADLHAADTSNIRGAGTYQGYKSKNKTVFEKDDLAEVRRLLESKNSILQERIGSGTYAEVYRAVNYRTKKVVAVKIIDLTKATDNYRFNFLPQELEIIRRLKHPRIVKIFTISQVGNKVVLIMEFAARGTLSEWIIQNGSFNEKNSWAMFREFFSGLIYMHEQSIAHRDLKLENILITHRLIPKLADFSFSVIFDGRTLCTNFCGSLPYFAPELLMNKPYNPLASDVWSLGVCLFIMTNDNFPFKFDNTTTMLELQLKKAWKFRTKVEKLFSAHCKHLFRRIFEPETSLRITSNQIMQHPWIQNKPT